MWTSVLNLVALAVSLWLGLYTVTRNPRSRISWLASLTLWSLSGYFYDSFLHLNPPPGQASQWWMGWTVLLTGPLWLHLSVSLVARPRRWHRPAVGAGYAWALALLLVELSIGGVFGVWSGQDFGIATAQRPGTWYPAVFVPLVAAPALSAWVLYRDRAACLRTLRRSHVVLVWATALSTIGGAYLTLAVWLSLPVPILPGQGALVVALALLGFAVARHNALVEGRSTPIGFAYAALAIAVVIAVYALAVHGLGLVYAIPSAVSATILALVVVTHSLYEWGGTALERLFYRRQHRRLRANLRAFAREAQEHDLGEHLGSIVASLCQSLGYRSGWVALGSSGALAVAARHPAGQTAQLSGALGQVPEKVLSLDAPALQEAGLGNATVAPLYAGGQCLGTLVVADRPGGPVPGMGRELDLLETVADQVASLIYTVRQQEAAAQQIDGMVRDFRAREQVLRQELQSLLSAADGVRRGPVLRSQVEDALRHLYDYAYLGQHELATLAALDRHLAPDLAVVTSLDRGRALNQLLIAVIEKLRPPGPTPKPLSRQWEQYTILHDAYVQSELNRDIMGKLYISESSFNRARRRAVHGVTRAVQEMERAAQEGAS